MGRLYEALTGFIPGALAGATAVILGQPIDEIKFKVTHFSYQYRGYFDCLKKTLRYEGFRGLYSGAVLNLYVHMAENAVLFGVLGECANIVRTITNRDKYEDLSIVEKASAGSLASICTTFIHCPATVVRSRMDDVRIYEHIMYRRAGFTGVKKPLGAHIIILSIIRNEGYHNLFKRFFPIMVREMFGIFVYFGGFFTSISITDKLRAAEDIHILQIMLSGGVGGACYWTAVNPIFVVYSKSLNEAYADTKFWPIMFKIIRREGFMELFSGLKPVLLHSVPANAVLFAAICAVTDYFFY